MIPRYPSHPDVKYVHPTPPPLYDTLASYAAPPSSPIRELTQPELDLIELLEPQERRLFSRLYRGDFHPAFAAARGNPPAGMFPSPSAIKQRAAQAVREHIEKDFANV